MYEDREEPGLFRCLLCGFEKYRIGVMTMSNSSWVKVQGTAIKIHRSLKDINGRAKNVIRDTNTQIFLEVPDSELGWVEKVVKDIGLSGIVISAPPKYGAAACGALTTDVKRHQLHCSKCYPLTHKGVPWADRNKQPPITITKPVKTPELPPTSVPVLTVKDLPSLINIMKARLDECMTLAQNYESAIRAVESISTLDNRLAEIRKEQEQHKKALATFLA